MERRVGDGLVLICRADRLDAVLQAGLGSPAGWDAVLSSADRPRSGRGPVARIMLAGGAPIVAKKLRRGGLLAPFRRDRFFGAERLERNVSVPLEARRRGIPTAAPVVLLQREVSLGFREAWLGVDEIEGAVDLRARLSDAAATEPAEFRAAMGAVRSLHDRGIHHPDLNLGNILTRRDPAGWSAFVVDLDRARAGPGPLGFRARQAAVRRIERSYAKTFPHAGPLGTDGADLWYQAYADGDVELASRLARGRALGRFWLSLHRFRWRLSALARAWFRSG